jgi:hypothetical protein
MILSAKAIASEIADSDAGEFLPSHWVNFRAARMQAAIRITRFLPSSTLGSVAYSPFVRYKRISLFIIDFRICTTGVDNFSEGLRSAQGGAERMKKPATFSAGLLDSQSGL